MALFNHVIREVHAKIVYFGPPRGGKETSLTHVYRHLERECRSPFKALRGEGNRLLFFDYQTPDSLVSGYTVRFHLYTVSEELLSPATWLKVFRGGDGVVFVADSDPSRLQDNMDRLNELQELLAAEGTGMERIPVVMQYNRRDHPDAVTLDELQRTLNRFNVPGFPSIAVTGEGVEAPLSCLSRMVLATIREALEELLKGSEETGVGSGTGEEAPQAVLSGREAAGDVAACDETDESPFLMEEAALPVEAVPVQRGDARAERVRLEIAGGGALDNGRLTVPVTVTADGGRHEFRLVLSFAAEEACPVPGQE